MGSLRVVELEGAAHCVEDVVRDPACVAALEPRVVLDADASHERHFFAPQTAHAAMAAEGREAGPLGLRCSCS